MLDFERSWWATTGGKEAAIAAQFAMSPVRYYQLLNRLLLLPAALAYDAVTVNRLCRIRCGRNVDCL
ncbi:DUF3263 domain-containing protein [Mycobacterium intracellulare]|uniref:DUF3263 domain-containing protein n=1 Tax=Mycobacterium intracellulare TaxID=1767 RepID=UPI000B1827AE|nr:DUF3263 domain-containing protein [Mycobacterium intracellulare]